MTNSDPFKRAEDEYFRLKGQLAAGRITRAQFDAGMKALMVQDAQGRYWMLGADDSKWYVHEGAQWIQAEPSEAQSVKPLSLPERGAPAAPQAPSVARKSNSLPLVVIGVFVAFGLGAVAFFALFNRSASPQAAQPPTNIPTVAPAATVQVAVVTEMPAPSASVLPTALVAAETPTAAPIVSTAPGVQVMLLSDATPVPITAKDFAAHNAALAEKIAILNQAELKFIRDLRALSYKVRTTGFAFPAAQKGNALIEQDLKDIAGKAMDVAILADELSSLAAKQDNGSAQAAQSADAYASIARNALALLVDAQNVRAALQSGTIPGGQAIELIAEYGAQMWNSEVTDGNSRDNPFSAFTKNAEPVQALNPNAAAQVQSNVAGLGSIWIAQSGTQTTKTINVPAAQAPVSNPFDTQLLRSLTTAEGQSDGAKAQQVAAANLMRLGATTSAADPTKPTQLQMPTNSVAVAEGGQIQSGNLPTFPAGKAIVVAKNNSGDENPFLQSFGLNGEQPPTAQGKTVVKDAPPLVNLNITNIVITGVNKRPKDSFNTFEADVTYSFTVNWSTNLGSPQFTLDCVSGNHFDISSAAGSQQVSAKGLLILYPGAEDAYCYASHNGNTFGSASVHFLVGDAAEATKRALQVETDSAALDATLTADAHGTENAQQTQAAGTVQVLATMNALETEVGGTQTAEFKLTAAAFGTKQAQPPPETATPSVTPTFTPKVVDQISHPGNIFAVSTNVVLERGHLYRFTFGGQVNLINPTRSVSASDLPEHVNGVTVPASGIVVVEGTGGVATITCGSGEPDPDNPGAFGITVEDLGPL